MGATKKLELGPDEMFLEQALKDGRAKKTMLSMKVLGKPDRELQARVLHLNPEHCSRLARTLAEQDALAPVVVFTDGKKWLLGDGHHRHKVYLDARKPEIPAYVIESAPTTVYREALEYATMCNRTMCLGRKPEDVRRAVEMLLKDDQWFERSDLWIAEHVGCYTSTVKTCRVEYCSKSGKSEPEAVLQRGGTRVKYKRSFTSDISEGHYAGRDTFAFSCNGERYFSTNKDSLNSKRDHVISAVKERISRSSVQGFLSYVKRNASIASVVKRQKNTYPELFGYWIEGIVCVPHKMLAAPCDLFSGHSPLMAVARLIGCRRLLHEQGHKDALNWRLIVACYPEDGAKDLIELYRKEGIEFMTPEELVESLKESNA